MRKNKSKRVNDNDVDIISELNVVPYIDVMLVLLIIFMVTTPLMQHSIDVNLPETSAGQQNFDSVAQPIIITVDKHGKYYLNASDVAMSELKIKTRVLALLSMNENNTSKIYVRGDKDAPYDYVIQLISSLKGAGRNIDVGLMSSSL